MALNAKQKLFIKEYCVDKNATKAAIRTGYSAKTAGSIGHELLKKPQIKIEIEKQIAKQIKNAERRAEEKGMSKERWLEELGRIGLANIDDVAHVSNKGRVTVYPTDNRAYELGATIKKITSTKYGPSIELHSKQSALETVGKHYGWVKETTENRDLDKPQVILTMPDNSRSVRKPEPVAPTPEPEKKASGGS